MSNKPAETTQTQPLLTDPIYKGSSITLDYETTVKNLCLAIHNNFDYHPKTMRLKGSDFGKGFEFDAAAYPNTRAAIDKLHKQLAAYEKGTDKSQNQFYLVMFNLKSLVEESRKDDGIVTKNKLTLFIEDFIKRNDAHIVLYALEHLDRTNKKLMGEIKRLEGALAVSERSRESFVREKNKLEATVIKYGNQSMNESQLNIDKGTFGHELMKLKAIVSKFKLNVVYHLQLALNDLAKDENNHIRVFKFLADLQSLLLKDVRHLQNTALFLDSVISHLTFGFQLLLNENAENDKLSEEQKAVITGLFEKLVNPEINTPIHELFADVKAKHPSDALVSGILDTILSRWKTLIPEIDNFSPHEIHLLSTTIDECNKATKLVAKDDHRPRMLEPEKASTPGEYLTTLYKVVISIYQIHFDKTFFAIEGKPEWDGLRDYSTAYFKQLYEFIVKVTTFMKTATQKAELSTIEGYKPEYDDVLKDIYDKIWEDRAQRALNKSANLNVSTDKVDPNKSLSSHGVRDSLAPRDLKTQQRPPAISKKRQGAASAASRPKGRPEPTQLKEVVPPTAVVETKSELPKPTVLKPESAPDLPPVTEHGDGDGEEFSKLINEGGKENAGDDSLFL